MIPILFCLNIRLLNAHSILFIESTTHEKPDREHLNWYYWKNFCRVIDTKIHFILICLEFEKCMQKIHINYIFRKPQLSWIQAFLSKATTGIKENKCLHFFLSSLYLMYVVFIFLCIYIQYILHSILNKINQYKEMITKQLHVSLFQMDNSD